MATIYTCMMCGEVMEGSGFYCEGCGNYVCWNCAIRKTGTDTFTCPNCTGELSAASF